MQMEAEVAVTRSPAAVLRRMGHGIWAIDNRLVPSFANRCFPRHSLKECEGIGIKGFDLIM